MTYPVVVYGVPYTPPPPPLKLKRPGRNFWTGWDGSVWDLGDWGGGVIFADGEITGMHMPPFERHTSTSPAISGSRWRGARTLERPVDWNILIWHDETSEGWIERDRGFWKTMRPDRTGVWTHEAPDGTRRRLRLRYEGGDHGFARDPHLDAGYVLYQPQLVAEDPYWYGDDITRSWGSPAPVSFFDAAGSPPFHITASSTISDAKIPNPGDVDAWPIWTIHGPMTSISIEFNGGTLGLPDVAAGETLVVNTDPRVATATLNGADMSGLVDPWDPRPVPPNDEVPTSISTTGSGTVVVSLTPRFYRAW